MKIIHKIVDWALDDTDISKKSLCLNSYKYKTKKQREEARINF